VTAPRAAAYGRVMRTLADLGPSKLLSDEQRRIRHAADCMLFCSDLVASPATRAVLVDLNTLVDRLVDSGRWTDERAGRLFDDVWACGPGAGIAQQIAA
jgi:hypothetical protein